MKKIITLALILSFNVFSSEDKKENTSPIITASQLAERVRQQGADKVLRDMFYADVNANSGEWNYIVNHLINGNSDWLNVIPLLADTGAEGMNTDISRALALALVKNTDGVLAILNDRIIPISTRDVCSMPLYNKTISEENEYVVKAIQALYKSNSVQAQKCLQQLITTVGQSDPSWRVD